MALTDNIVGCWSPSVRGSGYLLPGLANNNSLTLYNTAATAWVSSSIRGNSGRMVEFDGVNDYAGTASRIRFEQQATLSMWLSIITAPGAGTDKIIAELSSNFTVTNGWILTVEPTSFLGYCSNVGSTFNGSRFAYAYSVGVPFHAVLNYNRARAGAANVVEMWVNGSKVSQTQLLFSNVSGANFTFDRVFFGARDGGSVVPCNFRMGEALLFKRNLTEPEIVELYRRGNGAIGRELTGQTRRRVYGFVPAGFRAYWVQQKSRVIGGGV